MWKKEKFTATKIFFVKSSNQFRIHKSHYYSKPVSLTKFLQHNEMKNLLSLENISSNQLNNFFTYHREKMLLSRNFCQKQCGNKIRKFPHCDIPKTPISKCTGVPGTFVKTIPTLKRLNNFVFSWFHVIFAHNVENVKNYSHLKNISWKHSNLG